MNDKLPTKKQVSETAKKLAKKTADVSTSLATNPVTYKILGVSVVAYLIYKTVSSLGKKIEQGIEGDTVHDTIDGTGGNTQGATITQAEASNYAQSLLDAMHFTEWGYAGTDEESILTVFNKIIVPQDFILIYNAFGVKSYTGYGLPTGTWFEEWVDRDLVYWLKSELAQDDIGYATVSSVVNEAGFSF